MFQLIRSAEVREWAMAQSPFWAASLLIANTYFHFGSFLLESVAFAGLWFLLDAAAAAVSWAWRRLVSTEG